MNSSVQAYADWRKSYLTTCGNRDSKNQKVSDLKMSQTTLKVVLTMEE